MVVWTFLLSSVLSLLFLPLWETARYRLKYCLKGPLNPKQPTNQPCLKNPKVEVHIQFFFIKRITHYHKLSNTFHKAKIFPNEEAHYFHAHSVTTDLRMPYSFLFRCAKLYRLKYFQYGFPLHAGDNNMIFKGKLKSTSE